MHPTKREGANVPPTPPPPLVAEVANALRRMMARMKIAMADEEVLSP